MSVCIHSGVGGSLTRWHICSGSATAVCYNVIFVGLLDVDDRSLLVACVLLGGILLGAILLGGSRVVMATA